MATASVALPRACAFLASVLQTHTCSAAHLLVAPITSLLSIFISISQVVFLFFGE
jgi:hypothetical protein